MSEKMITIKEFIAAPASQVYRAFGRSQGLLEWMADDGAADARPGGRFYAWWNAGFYASGMFKAAEKDRSLAFTWQSPLEPAATEVTVSLAEVDGGTELTLVHAGLGVGEVWEQAAENFAREWKTSLANLKSVLETGVDRRLYDRPMLGFFIGGLISENEGTRKRLGLPIDYGMHVAGLVEGMGAQRSGLLADDVIAEVDGAEVRTFQSLAPVLGKYKGGDVVRTVIYRGPERIELDVELSRRPVPDFPPQPAELAALGRRVYGEMIKELRSVLKDATEKQTFLRPSEGEWSARHAMAHLLVSERWAQVDSDLLPEGNLRPPFPGSARLVDAIAGTYSTKRLFNELKRSIEVNMKMIETLPEEFAANKGPYFLLGNDLENGIRTHFGEHIVQIRAAIEAARSAG